MVGTVNVFADLKFLNRSSIPGPKGTWSPELSALLERVFIFVGTSACALVISWQDRMSHLHESDRFMKNRRPVGP